MPKFKPCASLKAKTRTGLNFVAFVFLVFNSFLLKGLVFSSVLVRPCELCECRAQKPYRHHLSKQIFIKKLNSKPYDFCAKAALMSWGVCETFHAFVRL